VYDQPPYTELEFRLVAVYPEKKRVFVVEDKGVATPISDPL
jgi:hypothetical protein